MKRLSAFFLAAVGLLFTQLAVAALPGPLVEPEWLEANLDDVVVLDVRSNPRSFTAPARLARDKESGKLRLVAIGGHIPGAALVEYKKLRADRMVDGQKVTRMIVDADTFADLMQTAGVRADRPVVIVSDGTGVGDLLAATRLYWQLKYYGKDDLAILNGGMARWLLEQRAVTVDTPAAERGDWKPTAERTELFASSADVQAAMEKGDVQLIDNRDLPQYLGVWHKSYVYAGGHIPGAKLFSNDLMTNPGAPAQFLASDQLAELHKAMGIDPAKPAITYCNSGALASGGWFVLHELMGNEDVKLYDGSMHQWTLEKRPTAAGVME